MKLKELLESSDMMSADKIRQAMAESGKSSVKHLMDYMKAKYDGKYDVELAKTNAKELVADMKRYN